MLAYGGVMLAFGLPIVAWFILRPAAGRSVPRAFPLGVGIALVAAAAGIGLLIVVTVGSLPSAGGSAARPDAGVFLTTTRPGQLLLARLGVSLVVGIVAIVLARAGRPAGRWLRRSRVPRPASA